MIYNSDLSALPMPAVIDPTDPKIDRWLRSIEPRQELAVRCAMRQRFPTVRADRAFNARIEEVRARWNPSESQLAMVLADANHIADHVEQLLGASPPETRTRERERRRS